MSDRATTFKFSREREKTRVLIWNNGEPFVIDARFRIVQTFPVAYERVEDLLRWAAENQIRCIGFGRDIRPARASSQVRSATWAVE